MVNIVNVAKHKIGNIFISEKYIRRIDQRLNNNNHKISISKTLKTQTNTNKYSKTEYQKIRGSSLFKNKIPTVNKYL